MIAAVALAVLPVLLAMPETRPQWAEAGAQEGNSDQENRS
jgi:hypothetical protein